MKRLLLSLSLLGTVALHADKLHDFLMQSGTFSNYEQLTVKQKEALKEYWSKIETICSDSKEAFAQLTQDNQEGTEILKKLLGKGEVSLAISLTTEKTNNK